MRGTICKVGAVLLVLTIPATALAAKTYKGNGTDDPAATMKIVVGKKDGKRKIKLAVAEKLRYQNHDGSCTGSGRTDTLRLPGPFKVKGNGEFRAVGPVSSGLGELKVIGDVRKHKVVGRVVFTFGKDGCKTKGTDFVAERV